MAKVVSDKTTVNEERDAGQRGSRLIGRVLPPAVRFWVRSQVEQVEQLTIDLIGRDLQIIKGDIPGVAIAAQQVIYEGLHVSEVALSASDIRINIGQVVRGKPLRLLEPFPVRGKILLSSEDVNRSMGSSLLKGGLSDFWRALVQRPEVAQAVNLEYGSMSTRSDVVLWDPKIRLADSCLGLSFIPAVSDESGDEKSERPVVLATKLSILRGQYLKLSAPVWLSHLDQLDRYSSGANVGKPITPLDGFQWNLGKETELTSLDISATQLACDGQVIVQP